MIKKRRYYLNLFYVNILSLLYGEIIQEIEFFNVGIEKKIDLIKQPHIWPF